MLCPLARSVYALSSILIESMCGIRENPKPSSIIPFAPVPRCRDPGPNRKIEPNQLKILFLYTVMFILCPALPLLVFDIIIT